MPHLSLPALAPVMSRPPSCSHESRPDSAIKPSIPSNSFTGLPMKKRKSPISASFVGAVPKKKHSDDTASNDDYDDSDDGLDDEEESRPSPTTIQRNHPLKYSPRNPVSNTPSLSPQINDVLIGKGPECFHHIGNRRFRVLVEVSIGNYFDDVANHRMNVLSVSPTDKQRQIVDQIVRSIEGNAPPGRFLFRQSSSDGLDESGHLGEIANCSTPDQVVTWRIASREEAVAKVHSTFLAAGRFLVKKAVTGLGGLDDEEKAVAVEDAESHESMMVDSPSASNDFVGASENAQRGKPVLDRLPAAPDGGVCERKQNLLYKPDAPISASKVTDSSYSPPPSGRSSVFQQAMQAELKMRAENKRSPTPRQSSPPVTSSGHGDDANAGKSEYETALDCPPSIKAFRTQPLEHFFVKEECDNVDFPYTPSSYRVPSNYDVLCGPGQAYFHHVGNRRFRIMIEMHVHRYEEYFLAMLNSRSSSPVSSNDSRSGEDNIDGLVKEMLQSISKCDPPGRFLGMDLTTGRWIVLNHVYARLKTEQTFFECMQVKSAKAKRIAALMESMGIKEKESNLVSSENKRPAPQSAPSDACLACPADLNICPKMQNRAKDLLRRRQATSCSLVSSAAADSLNSKNSLAMSEIMRKFCHEQSEASRALLRKIHTICPESIDDLLSEENADERRNSFPNRSPAAAQSAEFSKLDVSPPASRSDSDPRPGSSVPLVQQHPGHCREEKGDQKIPCGSEGRTTHLTSSVEDLMDVVGGMMMMRRTSC